MITLCTHTDLDGAGCAVLAKRAFGHDNLDIHYCNYDDIDDTISACLDAGDTQKLFITDISPQSKAVCERLDALYREKTLEIVCLDHHKTAAHLDNHPWGARHPTRCGTRLFDLWLQSHDWTRFSEEKNGFVLAVEAWDLWQTSSPFRKSGERLQRLCEFMGFERFVNSFTESFVADDDPVLGGIDEMLQDNQKRYIEQAFSTLILRDNYAVVCCTTNISTVCAEVLRRFSQVHYAVNLDLSRNVGDLRSREGEVDVSKIATALGGGGHPAAAGFPFQSREILMDRLQEELKKC